MQYFFYHTQYILFCFQIYLLQNNHFNSLAPVFSPLSENTIQFTVIQDSQLSGLTLPTVIATKISIQCPHPSLWHHDLLHTPHSLQSVNISLLQSNCHVLILLAPIYPFLSSQLKLISLSPKQCSFAFPIIIDLQLNCTYLSHWTNNIIPC